MGDGRVEVFALGAQIGQPLNSISLRAISDDGMRIATVLSPPVTSSGTISLFGSTIVTGPGINLSTTRFAFSGTDAARKSICPDEAI